MAAPGENEQSFQEFMETQARQFWKNKTEDLGKKMIDAATQIKRENEEKRAQVRREYEEKWDQVDREYDEKWDHFARKHKKEMAQVDQEFKKSMSSISQQIATEVSDPDIASDVIAKVIFHSAQDFIRDNQHLVPDEFKSKAVPPADNPSRAATSQQEPSSVRHLDTAPKAATGSSTKNSATTKDTTGERASTEKLPESRKLIKLKVPTAEDGSSPSVSVKRNRTEQEEPVPSKPNAPIPVKRRRTEPDVSSTRPPTTRGPETPTPNNKAQTK